MAKGTVVYLRGENGVVKGAVARDLRPARQSIEVRWSTSGRLVKLPIEAGKRELFTMRESKRKQHGQANAKITGHVALLPPSGVVTVTITPADQSVHGFEILGSGVTFKGEGASRRNGQRGAYVYEIAWLGVLDDPEEAYSKITVQRFYRGASNSELSSSHDHLLARTPVLSYRFRQSISVKQQLTRPSTVETFHSSLHGDMEVPLIHVDIVDQAIVARDYPTSTSVVYYHAQTAAEALHLVKPAGSKAEQKSFKQIWESSALPFAEMNDSGNTNEDYLLLQTDEGTGTEKQLGLDGDMRYWVCRPPPPPPPPPPHCPPPKLFP